jgi:hypothetical protein
MSSKELVVELRIPLPDDLFEQAEVISGAKACMDAIEAAMPGEMAHTITSEIVTRRATAANGAGKRAGRPRKEAPADGAPAVQ